VVLVRSSLIGKELPICPSILSYKLNATNESMYNTPPCWSIYVTGLMAKYIKEKGGMHYWHDLCNKKASMVYDVINGSSGFFKCPVETPFRSNTNICFKMESPSLEKAFLAGCDKAHLHGLEGHRSVGGMRASIFTGMTLEGVVALADYMKEFQQSYEDKMPV